MTFPETRPLMLVSASHESQERRVVLKFYDPESHELVLWKDHMAQTVLPSQAVGGWTAGDQRHGSYRRDQPGATTRHGTGRVCCLQHTKAAKQRDGADTIKSGDRISCVKVMGKMGVRPIEKSRKDEIDAKKIHGVRGIRAGTDHVFHGAGF